jgi:hypothetical protein
MAFNFDLNFVKTQIAIIISESPIKTVNNLEFSSPKMLATICSCLGTRFSTLQTSPFISQTVAIRRVRVLWRVCSLIAGIYGL